MSGPSLPGGLTVSLLRAALPDITQPSWSDAGESCLSFLWNS